MNGNRSGAAYHLYHAVATSAGFGAAQVLSDLQDPAGSGEGAPLLTADGLKLYYATARTGAAGQMTNIWLAQRASTQDPFSNPAPVDTLSSDGNDYPIFITADECTIYIASDRAGGTGGRDIWRAQRQP